MRCARLLLTVLGVANVATMPAQDVAERPPEIGWYAFGGGRRVLVSPAADSSRRLLDFDALQFHRLEPVAAGGFVLAGQGSWNGGRLEVTGTSGSLRLVLAGGVELEGHRAITPPFMLREVSFMSDTIRIAGLLLMPVTGEPVPGVVMIHGSGSSDRDNIWAYTFAQFLARRGFAVLFPDKRGSGGSTGDWHAADFGTLAEDALAGVRFLRAQPEVGRSAVGLVGLSQGGWIAPLAATVDPSLAFTVSVSAAAVTPFEQLRHEVRQDLLRDGRASVERLVVDSLLRLSMVYSRSGTAADFATYRTYRRELVAAGHADLVEPFPTDPDNWRLAWWGMVGDVDPIATLAHSTVPALFIYGSDDEHDNVPVAESVGRLDSLRRARPDRAVDVQVFPGMGHTLVSPASGWVSGEVLEVIVGWLKSRATHRPRR